MDNNIPPASFSSNVSMSAQHNSNQPPQHPQQHHNLSGQVNPSTGYASFSQAEGLASSSNPFQDISGWPRHHNIHNINIPFNLFFRRGSRMCRNGWIVFCNLVVHHHLLEVSLATACQGRLQDIPMMQCLKNVLLHHLLFSKVIEI